MNKKLPAIFVRHVFLLFSLSACALDQEQIKVKGNCDKESIIAVRTILKLDSLKSSRTLLLSDRVCRVCLDEVIATLGSTGNEKNVSILVVSGDSELAKQLTSIYRRHNIPFSTISRRAYDVLLEGERRKIMSSIFLGIRQRSTKEYYVFDGRQRTRTSEESTASVLSFLLSESD